jgi:hypothetical protein
MPKKTPEVSSETVKELLKDAEASGLSRHQVDLKEVQDGKPYVYGPRGSEFRRAVQTKWYAIKRKSIDLYVKKLQQHGIEPSEQTKLELATFETGVEANVPTGLEEDGIEQLTRALQQVSLETPTTEAETTLPTLITETTLPTRREETTPTKESDIPTQTIPTPTVATRTIPTRTVPTPAEETTFQASYQSPKIYFASPPGHPFSPLYPLTSLFSLSPHAMVPAPVTSAPVMAPVMSPPRVTRTGVAPPATAVLVPAAHSNLSTMSEGPVFLGSKRNPFITEINLEFPERNFYFGAQVVKDFERDGWSRPGVHIRKTIAVPDFRKWAASQPKPEDFPDHANRCVLIKRPSRDAFERDLDLYFDGIGCLNTLKAHEATEELIREDDERQWLYYLLVFPRVIDNEIFEGSGQRVIPTRHNPLCLDAADLTNTFKTDLHSMHVYWEIAFKVDGTPMRQKSKGAPIKDEDIFKKKSNP